MLSCSALALGEVGFALVAGLEAVDSFEFQFSGGIRQDW